MNNHIQTAISEQGIEAYLHAQQHKSLLRFLTCGSVDDGKSTLIGACCTTPSRSMKISSKRWSPTARNSAPPARSWT